MSIFKISRFTHDMEVKFGGRLFRALYNLSSKAFAILHPKKWLHVKTKLGLRTDDEMVMALAKNDILVDETVDETAVLRILKQQCIHDNGIVKSRILTGYICNFRCKYCYLESHKGIMSAETARLMDAFYIQQLKRINPHTCMDNYSGGEVLLNLNVTLTSASCRYHFCMGKGIAYEGGITTNGYLLTRSRVKQLTAAGLTQIRVTLLPGELHDNLRPYKNGSKTYKKIVSNLIDSSDLVGFQFECQYDAGNDDYKNIPFWLDDLEQKGINIKHIEFSPIFERRNESRFLAGVGDPGIHPWLMSEARQRGFNLHLEPPGNFCIADMRNYFVFDPAGNIIPCPTLGYGQFAYGNVVDGIDFIKESQILSRRLPDACKQECDIAPICYGGCRIKSYNLTGKFDGMDCQYSALKAALDEYIQARALQELSRNPQFVKEADECV